MRDTDEHTVPPSLLDRCFLILNYENKTTKEQHDRLSRMRKQETSTTTPPPPPPHPPRIIITVIDFFVVLYPTQFLAEVDRDAEIIRYYVCPTI